MKKNIQTSNRYLSATFIVLLISIVFTSCESNLNNDHKDTAAESTGNIKKANNSRNSLKALYFPNGMSAKGSNNMLHFSNYEEYEETLIRLENSVDVHEDSFVSKYDDLSEDELNDIEEDIGFNEDLPLDNFERDLNFISLRKVTLQAENKWLDTSDQPGFSWEEDPDDIPYIDGIERTLYNPWHEVMIADTIYKMTENGYYSIDASNSDAERALTFINENPTLDPIDIAKQYSSFITYSSSSTQDEGTCFYVNSTTKRFIRSDGQYRIKAKHKMQNTGPFNVVYKSVTKNYKKKGSKWKKRRIKSYAGLQGQVKDCFYYNGCQLLNYMEVDNHRSSYKKRKRREYALRFSRSVCNDILPGTKKSKLWSVHKQHDWVVEWEFEQY